MNVIHQIIRNGGQTTATAIVDGKPYVATPAHPNWSHIIRLLEDDERRGSADWDRLFDTKKFIAGKLVALSDRVSYADDTLLFDGDIIDNALSSVIVRLVREESDFMPLVRFMERVSTNPDAHSRENLYRWITASGEGFTITDDGMILGYKGVLDGREGGYKSSSAGTAFVNGVRVEGQIPMHPGDVVTMPRSEVNHDPSAGCSTGLHVGTWDYAKGFAGGNTLAMLVDPRDVVSVPTDCHDQKMRVCRYKVVAPVTDVFGTSVHSGSLDAEESVEEFDYCPDCGDLIEAYEDECADCLMASREADRIDREQKKSWVRKLWG